MSEAPPGDDSAGDTTTGPKPSIGEVAAWLRRAAEQRGPIEDLTPGPGAADPASDEPTEEPGASGPADPGETTLDELRPEGPSDGVAGENGVGAGEPSPGREGADEALPVKPAAESTTSDAAARPQEGPDGEPPVLEEAPVDEVQHHGAPTEDAPHLDVAEERPPLEDGRTDEASADDGGDPADVAEPHPTPLGAAPHPDLAADAPLDAQEPADLGHSLPEAEPRDHAADDDESSPLGSSGADPADADVPGGGPPDTQPDRSPVEEGRIGEGPPAEAETGGDGDPVEAAHDEEAAPEGAVRSPAAEPPGRGPAAEDQQTGARALRPFGLRGPAPVQATPERWPFTDEASVGERGSDGGDASSPASTFGVPASGRPDVAGPDEAAPDPSDGDVPGVEALVGDDPGIVTEPGSPGPDDAAVTTAEPGEGAPEAALAEEAPPPPATSGSLATLFDLDLAELAARARSASEREEQGDSGPGAGTAPGEPGHTVVPRQPATGAAGDLDLSWGHEDYGEFATAGATTVETETEETEETEEAAEEGDTTEGKAKPGPTPAMVAISAAWKRRRAKRKRYPRGQLKERIGILRRVRAMLGIVVLTVILGVAAGAAIGAFIVFVAFAVRSAITSG